MFVVGEGQGWLLTGDCLLSDKIVFFLFVFVCLFVVGEGQGWSLIDDCLQSDKFFLFVFLLLFVCCLLIFSFCFCFCLFVCCR